MKEKVVILFDCDDLSEITVYAERDGVEHKYPYSHRVAKSWIEMFEIVLKEFPEDIEIVKRDKEKDFIKFIEENGKKRYISTVPVEMLNKIFPTIFRKVVKGVRLDVN